jgi:hypothetical protein
MAVSFIQKAADISLSHLCSQVPSLALQGIRFVLTVDVYITHTHTPFIKESIIIYLLFFFFFSFFFLLFSCLISI